jgi:prolyl oligopeptidase
MDVKVTARAVPGAGACPETRQVEQIDDYFGTSVADPYRWLEDPNSVETQAWVEAQNRLTFTFLERIPARRHIRERLTTLWDYERYGVPSKQGPRYVFSRNEGLQPQPVIYKTPRLEAEPEVLLDPNPLSPDGTVAVAGTAFTLDGRYMAYALSSAGSDWMEWRVRNVETGADLPDDRVRWSKFGGASWLKDGTGFFYSRYDEPQDGEIYQGVNRNQKVFFHRIGTAQEEDELVHARPDQPDWGFNAEVTEDGRFLLISQWEGTERKNRIFIRDLEMPGSKVEPFPYLDRFDAQYTIVGNDGTTFYVLTDKDAPRGRLVAIDWRRSSPDAWTVLIPEGPDRDVLASVGLVGDTFFGIWRIDVQDTVRVYALDGTWQRDVPLPGIGTVQGFAGRRDHAETFFAFTSFIYPTTTFRYDVREGTSSVFRQPEVDFTPADYETTQVFCRSKDGTRIPMFLTCRKGLERDGQNPTYLYGYGGFDVSLTPAFSPAVIAWLEMGGIYAVANLRGGGEYGKEWHDAGRLRNKQNVFDDFIAAAEYLIAERYTSTPKLAIGGGSNGGLLVGAVLNQRPDLFGAAVPAVGVMDMLRFDQFTIGWAWTSDYGSASTKEGFETLFQYSPLHNIRPGTRYPATLVTTADHDDRVVPAHSHKYIATLQAAQAGPAPVLTRIETRAGHGANRSTQQVIEERADVWAFLVHVLEMKVGGSSLPGS